MVNPALDFSAAGRAPGAERDPRPTPRTAGRSPARDWRRRVLAALTLGLVLTAALHARAAFELGKSDWEGASELLALAREQLGTTRVEPVARLDYGALTPKDGVLVLHPESPLDGEQVSAFLAAGGRLAILDDYGTGSAVLARYRIHRIQAPLRPAQALRDNPNLAIARPAVQSVAGQEQNRHPIVARVDRLVTNHPTAFTHPNLTPVLTIAAVGEPDAALALTGIIAGRGRLFAMGDPSAVMNLMLRYPGNRAFALGLVEYLVEDDTWGARGGKLYLVANRFTQTGRFARASGVVGQMTEAADEAREALRNWQDEGLPPGVSLGVAIASLLAALTWALLYALRRFRRLEPRYASATPLLMQGGLPGRAAVLGAPTTDRALVVAELDILLSEELARRAGLPPTASAEAALTALAERGASPSLLLRARELLLNGRQARTALLSRKSSRLKTGRVAEMERNISELLAEIDDPGHKAEAAAPPPP